MCFVVYSDGEHEFLDLNEKLSKLAKFAPHLWKDDVSGSILILFLHSPSKRLRCINTAVESVPLTSS